MSEKIYIPGEVVEKSGLYPVVDQDGNEQGYEVTVVQGEPFPPTPEKGWGFGTPRLAKTTDGQEDLSSADFYSFVISQNLPDHRPVFQSSLALVPSRSLPEGRPVLARSKKVADCNQLPLHRPIFQSDITIAKMYGNRPVLSTASNYTTSSFFPERRPVYSQQGQVDSSSMGYID